MEFLHLSQMKLLKRIKQLWYLSGYELFIPNDKGGFNIKADKLTIGEESPRKAQVVKMSDPIDKFLIEDNQE